MPFANPITVVMLLWEFDLCTLQWPTPNTTNDQINARGAYSKFHSRYGTVAIYNSKRGSHFHTYIVPALNPLS